MPEPLSSGDLENQPAREVGFYGGVRNGWTKTREGLEEVVKHLDTLMQQDPNNFGLQRYITQVQKVLEKVHKLQMRMARVKDRAVMKRKKESPHSWDPSQHWRMHEKGPFGESNG